ncbi:unnamed protein product [Vitrella brassicaformis CCMP3155]|uniref:Protein phosphatase n=1 Tax=Vitrella brassicaformis (strain CCMP3155) TaxID=1169540 RepID=A0A0G4FNE7_VITBC|nr:unnamed protein product [Vitrella brassicaformis CCMP3155]|eukprot:CEM15775.1 unnamed protein product [Vitrella brassicaformis CCMP3155]
MSRAVLLQEVKARGHVVSMTKLDKDESQESLNIRRHLMAGTLDANTPTTSKDSSEHPLPPPAPQLPSMQSRIRHTAALQSQLELLNDTLNLETSTDHDIDPAADVTASPIPSRVARFDLAADTARLQGSVERFLATRDELQQREDLRTAGLRAVKKISKEKEKAATTNRPQIKRRRETREGVEGHEKRLSLPAPQTTEAPNDSPTLTTDHFPPLLPTINNTGTTTGKRSSRGSLSSPAQQQLRLEMGAYIRARDDKRGQCEDAASIPAEAGVMVVADGVGGFVDDHPGVSARDFARAVTVKTMDEAMAMAPLRDARTNRAKQLVEEGWAKTAADRHGPPGASTIAVAATTHDEEGRPCVDVADNGDTAVDQNIQNGCLHFISDRHVISHRLSLTRALPRRGATSGCGFRPPTAVVLAIAAATYDEDGQPCVDLAAYGDSIIMVVSFPHHGPPIIVTALEPMHHRNQLNYPFQLQRIPRRRAADILIPPPATLKRLTRTDHRAEDATEATIGTFRSLPADRLAAHLARLAYRKSKNKSEKLDTPFRQMWEAHGEEWLQGGKEDDITVLVAKVGSAEGV